MNRIFSINKSKDAKILIALSFLGFIVPFIFHITGNIGRVFMPMHFFIILGAYLLSPVYALFLAVILPVISSLLIGMPIVYPILPIMLVEFLVYTTVILVFKRKNIYYSLILAMIAGRIAASLTVVYLGIVYSLGIHPIRYIEAGLITGLPGIIFQIILIPIIISLINNQSSPWKELNEYD